MDGNMQSPQNPLKMRLGWASIALAFPLAILFFALGASAQNANAVGEPIFVRQAASGSNNGSSWNNAFKQLQPALDVAQPGDEIWVAAGVYTPTNIDALTATFQLKPGVALYGGFAGTESQRTQRNWNSHLSVLSGDLGGDDLTDAHGVVTDIDNIIGDNAYHVVVTFMLTESTVLDGFVITAGKSDSDDYPNQFGAGMANWGSSMTLANLTFSGNQSGIFGGGMCNLGSTLDLHAIKFTNNYSQYGGGMYNQESGITLDKATFIGNQAELGGGVADLECELSFQNTGFRGNSAEAGGGLYNYASMVNLENVLFSGNLANPFGGGIYNLESEVHWVNATLSGNRAVSQGGGFFDYESMTYMVNSILWGNSAASDAQLYNTEGVDGLVITYTNIQAGFQGTGNLNVDPRFVAPVSVSQAPTSAGDYHLKPGPVVDVGVNSAVQLATDLDGLPRIKHNVVDLGAYEGQFEWMYLPLVRK